jgi:hypothetical protein
LSPSATWSSMVSLKSGKAVRTMVVYCLKPSGPRGSPILSNALLR